MFNIGIDWASDHHDIAIVDDSGHKVSAFRIPHTRQGLDTLRDKLRELSISTGDKDKIIIGIETSRLLLVDFLLNEGYEIYAINPKAIDRYRDRYTSSQAKSDTFDAEVIAHALRTDRDRFRSLKPDSDLLRELRILVRDCRRFIRTKTLFLNQLRACLRDYYPVALELFSEFDSSAALEFLKSYPQATRVPAKKIEKLLRRNHHSSPEQKAKGIAGKLSQPQIPVDAFTVRAKSRSMLTLVEQLLSLRTRIKEYQNEIEALFEKHPDASIFKSLPGSGPNNGPRLLSEIGDNRLRYPNPDTLQCEAGTSPVTKTSGKTRIVLMRRACRMSLRDTMHQFSFCSISQSSWAKTFYDQQRAKGKTHASALRALADKWLKIIHHLWEEQIPYNEDTYLAARMRQQIQEVTAIA